MKKIAVTLLLSFAVSGCAGLKTEWLFQMNMHYVTPDEPVKK